MILVAGDYLSALSEALKPTQMLCPVLEIMYYGTLFCSSVFTSLFLADRFVVYF